MPRLWDEIKRISDELEVKVANAGAEVRAKWENLKPRVKELETKMNEKAGAASARVVEELNNVGTLLKELRDDVAKRVKPK